MTSTGSSAVAFNYNVIILNQFKYSRLRGHVVLTVKLCFIREELQRLQEALEANISAAELRVKTRREEELASLK